MTFSRLFTKGNIPYGNDGFEIWHNQDLLRDNWGIKHHQKASTTANADGSSNTSWLELNDAAYGQSQTLGIEREINTIAGADYTLNLDYAGRNGFASYNTGISIYLGNKLLLSHNGTSSRHKLNWQQLTVSFKGTGKAEKLRIITDSRLNRMFGRGSMIDNLRLTQSKQSNQGLENQAIALDDIQTTLTDTDGSEQLTLTLADIPVNTIVTDGVHTVTITEDNSTVDITGWQLTNLSITPPINITGELELTIIATSTESSTGSTAQASHKLRLDITPVYSSHTDCQSTNSPVNPYLRYTRDNNQQTESDSPTTDRQTTLTVNQLTSYNYGGNETSPVDNTVNLQVSARPDEEEEVYSLRDEQDDAWLANLETQANRNWQGFNNRLF